MKNVLIAVIAGITIMGTAAIATQATAGELTYTADPVVKAPASSPLGFNGFIEYAVEADTFEGGLGATYEVYYKTTAFTDVNFETIGGSEVQFKSMDFGVKYDIYDNADMYVKVNVNDSFNYVDTVVGASFNF